MRSVLLQAATDLPLNFSAALEFIKAQNDFQTSITTSDRNVDLVPGRWGNQNKSTRITE